MNVLRRIACLLWFAVMIFPVIVYCYAVFTTAAVMWFAVGGRRAGDWMDRAMFSGFAEWVFAVGERIKPEAS